MTEKQVQQKIKKYLEDKGCIVLKTGNVYRNGFPDLMVLRPDSRVQFIEVKKPGASPTPLQSHWLEKLNEMGFLAEWADDPKSIQYKEYAAYYEPLNG